MSLLHRVYRCVPLILDLVAANKSRPSARYMEGMAASNTHFSIAVHVLAALAMHEGQPVPSATLARSVNTNAAFVRQVIARLREAGLVKTRLGTGGGALLGREAGTITLLDVFRATQGRVALPTHTCDPGSPCVVAREVPDFLDTLAERLDTVVADELSATTVADLARRLGGS